MVAAKSKAAAKTEEKGETLQQQRNRLRSVAERAVIDAHRDEFNAKADEVFAAEGLTFNRRLTKDEQAERKVQALLDANPGLREKLAGQLAQASGPVPDSFGTSPALEQHEGSLELSGTLDQTTE